MKTNFFIYHSTRLDELYKGGAFGFSILNGSPYPTGSFAFIFYKELYICFAHVSFPESINSLNDENNLLAKLIVIRDDFPNNDTKALS
jgi:hypothetical protein